MDSEQLQAIEFQGKAPDEQLQFAFRQHGIRFFRTCTLVTLWMLVVLVAGYQLLQITEPGSSMRLLILTILFTLFFLSQCEFLSKFYRHFLNITIVTDKRIHRIKKTLLSRDDHQSMRVLLIQDIQKFQHGPLQNLLDFGSILLDAQSAKLKINFVPHVRACHQAIMQLRERERAASEAKNANAEPNGNGNGN